MPLVSVLMTAYNREKYIAEAIESVLASTYRNIELIIVDDCSKDDTVQIAKKYEANDARIKVYRNEKNLGDYHNRNKAASYAKGEYLKYVDSDDLIYPWGIEVMVYCMEKFPNAGFGLISYNLKYNQHYPVEFSPAMAYYHYNFNGAMIIGGPTFSIIRTTAFNEVGGFSGKQYLGDTELWFNLSAKFSLVALPPALAWWREHEDQQMQQELLNVQTEADRFHLHIRFLSNPKCPLQKDDNLIAIRNLKNRYARNLVKYFLRGDFKKTKELYKSLHFTAGDIVRSFRFNQYPKTYNQ